MPPASMAVPLTPQARRFWMGVLGVAYLLQTALVWTDPSPMEPLSGVALRGAEVWHEHNCQACHQLYGYGGFLGPDLTNAATMHGAGLRSQLAWALEQGPKAMPVVPISSRDIDALTAWLVAMDGTGLGQARSPVTVPRSVRFVTAVDDLMTSDGPAAAGWALWQSRPCGGCHPPLAVGVGGAPDLSRAATRLSQEELARVLDRGRPPGMPNPGLNADEQAAMAAWLGWLETHRPELAQALEVPSGVVWADLPWWEFQ